MRRAADRCRKYLEFLGSEKDNTGKVTFKETTSNIYILPDQLNIESDVTPEILHRGIFDAVVYNTKIKVTGKFSALELKKSGINIESIQWNKAKVDIGLSDLKGLKNNPSIKLADSLYALEPDFDQANLFTNNLMITADLNLKRTTDLNFSFDLDLRGSNELKFLHLGKTTQVKVKGNWSNPSFIGKYLPDGRTVKGNEFNATWKMPYFNRPFPQQWIGNNNTISNKSEEAAIGVKFILPVDQYQKTMRSAKYAILIIVLTFISLFFTELLSKKKIHLLQYVLIGAAMTIYYSLLLSFSEQIGFTLAYLIASVATVTLIAFFITALLNQRKTAFIFAGILSIFYGFIYVIIQLQDLALLFGSIGLFVIIAVLMYLSSKLDWTKKELE